MRVFLSEWVLPISSPPISAGAVAVEDGRVLAVGPAQLVLAGIGAAGAGPHSGGMEVTNLGDSVLLPALVNAHTHLELSWMGAESSPSGDYLAWVRHMMNRPIMASPMAGQAIDRGIREVIESGAALVGDVGNTQAARSALERSGLHGRFFLELIGANPNHSTGLFEAGVRTLAASEPSAAMPGPRVPLNGQAHMHSGSQLLPAFAVDQRENPDRRFPASIVPHGPHSVSSPLLRLIASRARETEGFISVHLAESAEESDLLVQGTGPFRELLENAGAIGAGWRHPGVSPTRVLDAAGLLGPRTLVVHGVHLTRSDAALLAERGTSLALCPRSNARLGVGVAPLAMLLAEGVRLALGTDSLASNDDLDVFAELAALRALAPEAPPAALLRAATLGGAEALGWPDGFGSIDPGKRASLIALTWRTSPIGSGGLAGRAGDPYARVFAGPKKVKVSALP